LFADVVEHEGETYNDAVLEVQKETPASLMHDGYTDLPPGKLAALVTYLEMREPPMAPLPTTSEFVFRCVTQPEPTWYRQIFRKVGEPWLWFSRLRMSDEELRTVLRETLNKHCF